ncbi:MAG: efflux RND transporter permease subunit [Candidatus Thiodiazotropha endolucinida]|uniref:Multidrug resistance protein MdtC n=1 Tax=Candidatus Thiodiazotropha endolucinida TaxID=1655433 RepID=A0A7Z0VN75_9GAMM|nr:efflux RND transporter permease subunit [Candidatus Thiodiazotropha endolucinida]MBT3014894.1 efflux RND transporter permease subunit [Candidatus Thiodiazotropha taylori]MBV2126085.1 efflux RND transporter permease subunit [Candidatus Thiodiazotropha taylori]MCG7862282.1 efflux RND transporter permease subunit [Candidatus Thiodiazotropha endolucinida]ODJ88553.1 multidrug resistance protein MdtC [Candidatus Thiodiazotropha endolucinida]
MRQVVAFSLKQRVFYNLMFVVLIVVGFISLFALPAERYPNFGFGEVIISTVYPGASSVEVESLVTRKIEDALEKVDDVEWISSTSFNGRSNIRLKFVDDSDYDALYNEVRFEVLNIVSELPQGVDPPSLLNAKVQDWLPVITINLVGDHSNRALALMGEEIKTRLLKIPHVQQVDFSGKQTQEFHIYLDPQKLREVGIGFDQVASALRAANLSIPAGKYTNESGEYLIKLDERFHSLDQVQSTVVRRDADGSLVRIQDLVSRMGMGYRDPIVIASVNGKPALGLKVIKSDQGNAMEIRDQVVALIDEFRPPLEIQGVDVVLTQDSTIYIKDGLTTLGMNMLVGIILVSLIIWYFMGVRNAGLVTIGIPFSFMITMLIMYLTGNSLNEITLFSFVLVTGIVVDDAIVVTENIYRHVQEGKSLREAIINGTAEVALPVISATMTTVAAFLPMLIMSGSTGQFFALVPKAVSFAIIASLVECLLILPIHYLDFGPRQQSAVDLLERDNTLMRVVRRFTDWLLSLTLRFRLLSVLVVSLLFAVSVMILALSASGKVPLIRIQFFPDDYKLYYVDIVGPSNISIQEVDERVKRIAETVMEDGPGMASAAAGLAGLYFNEDYEPVYGNNHGSVMVTMPSASEQSFDDPLAHLDRMREKLKPIHETDGYTLHVHPQNDGPPSGKDINVRVVGANVEAVSGLAGELLTYMLESPDIGPHLIGLDDDRGVHKRVFRLWVEQERVAEFGLDNSQVARLAASVLDGRYLGKYRHIDEEVDLKLRIDSGALQDPENALYIPVVEDAERPVYLADLVRVEAYNEPGEIKRYQGQRAISLKADIREGAPTSTPAIVNLVRDRFETIRDRYPGATVTFGGEHEDTQRSFESLAYAFIIAVLVMYVILATQFQSYLQPLIILSAVVFALIGVVFGKLVTQSLFTVNSFIAVIGVAGVVVNDALVLIDFINKRYRKGLSRRAAIIEGVHIRLRPILLTTLTTSLGLLPMAIGFPSYSLIWGTMASTFVTGLATATALTLFIIPVLWDLLQGLQERFQKHEIAGEQTVE